MAKRSSKVKAGQGEAGEAKTPPKTEATDRQTRYRRWKERVAASKKVRKEWEDRFEVERGERYFLGEQWKDVGDKDAMIVLNHFAASIDTDLPNLFYQDPKWFVRPTIRSHPSVEAKARVSEAILETVAKQDQNLKRAGALAVLQSYFRLGALEAVYEPRMVRNPDVGQPIYKTGTDGEVLRYPSMITGPPDSQSGLPQSVPHPMAGMPIPQMGQDNQPLIQPDEILSDEAFRFDWVDAALVLLDADGTADRSKWRWIGKEVLMPLEEAKAEKKFNDNRNLLVATEFTRRKGEERRPKPGEPDLEEGYVRLFVCYDIRDRMTRILAEAQPFEDFLFEGDTTPGVEDHPLSLLSYNPILGPDPSPWPKPPVYDWLTPQQDYNKARWIVREHAERLLPKEVYDESTFPNAEEMEKYKTGAVGILAQVNDTQKPPVGVQKPPMHDSLVRILPLLQGEWRIITGQTGARLADPSSDTATEAAFAERAGNLRDSRKQDAINDWLSRAGWLMLKLLRKNLTFKMWVKLRGYTNRDTEGWLMRRGVQPALVRQVPGAWDMVLNLLGQEKWEEIAQEDLDFDAEVQVVPGSARARNLEVERKQWIEFLQVLGAAPQIAMSRELLRETAEKFETINERMIDEIYALSQQMLAAKQAVAGHAGTGDNGGNMGVQGASAQVPGRVNALMAPALGNTQAVTGRAV